MISHVSNSGSEHIGLRKRLSYVGHKLKKIGSWAAETSQTSDCDVVVQFPKEALPFTINWLTNVIEKSSTGLLLKICKHEKTGLINILCSCTFRGLLKGAEEILLKKRLKDEHGGQLRDFFVEDSEMYENVEEPGLFFTSQERQQIVLHLLNNIRLSHTTKIQGHTLVEGQAIVPRLVTSQIIKQIYPLHNQNDLELLTNTWVYSFTSAQPLDAIKDYFGVHIGMYFAFLGHYTMALTVPAFLGVYIWWTSGTNQEQDDVNFVLFALINVVWSTIYIELWKRREAEYAFKWGTFDKQDDLITEPRPLYKGELRVSPVTGRLEPHFPKWKRNVFFYTISIPVMVLCHCVIVLVCVNFFAFYDIIKDRIESGQLYFLFKFVPSMFLAASVMVMDKVYGAIALWLNDRENYRSDEEYKNQLIIKLMVFQSVNSFLSLFYTAFYIQDFSRLRNQLAILFVVRQVVGNMKESLLSFIISKFKQQLGAVGATTNTEILRKLKHDCVSTVYKQPTQSSECQGHPTSGTESEGVGDTVDGVCEVEPGEQRVEGEGGGEQNSTCHLTQAESEGLLPKYDGTFEDYLEMVIQFSYVTWFSSVFPLAGFFALLNNVVEIRSDAFKICMSYQRPVGERVKNIGAWQTVLEVMSLGTIIVNTALIGISGPMLRLFPHLSTTHRLLLIVIMEHAVLALKLIIRGAISEVPEWVSIEMAKLEFSRREALRLRFLDQLTELNQCKGATHRRSQPAS